MVAGRGATVLAVMVTAGGCRFSVDYGDTHYRCDVDKDCPAGLTCGDDGVCGGPGSPGPDGGGPAADACSTSKQDLLLDGFDGEVDVSIWSCMAVDGATFLRDEGEQRFVVPGTAECSTVESYPLDENAVSVSIDDPPAGTEAYIRIDTSDLQTFVARVVDGSYSFFHDDGQGGTENHGFNGRAAPRHYLRLREAAGRLHLQESSGFGETWADLDSFALSAQEVKVTIGARPDPEAPTAEPATVGFDQIEIDASASCP